MNAVSDEVLGVLRGGRPAVVLDEALTICLESRQPTRLTRALALYWSALGQVAPETQRAWCASVMREVRSGGLAPSVLALLALGNADESLVYAATLDYVRQGPMVLERRATLVDESIEWVRRGLAINRGAAFAALISLCDESIHGRLAAVRLTLSPAEVATVCRLLAAHATELPDAFLRDWLELLNQSPPHAAAEPIAALLG